MVGVYRQTGEAVAVEPESCFQERGGNQIEGMEELLGNRGAMALKTGEQAIVQPEV
jgi:hypothetical protein